MIRRSFAAIIALSLAVGSPAWAADIAASFWVDGKHFKKNLKRYEQASSTVTVGLYEDDGCTSLVQEETAQSLAQDFLLREEAKSRAGYDGGVYSNGTKKPTKLLYVFDDVDLSGVTGDALYVSVACDVGTDCPIDTALKKTDTDLGACQPVAPLAGGGGGSAQRVEYFRGTIDATSAADLVLHNQGYVEFSQFSNSAADVFEVVTTGTFGVLIKEAGTITWDYGQAVVAFASTQEVQLSVLTDPPTGPVVRWVIPSTSDVETIQSHGTLPVAANTTLLVGFNLAGPPSDITQLVATPDWSHLFITWRSE